MSRQRRLTLPTLALILGLFGCNRMHNVSQIEEPTSAEEKRPPEQVTRAKAEPEKPQGKKVKGPSSSPADENFLRRVTLDLTGKLPDSNPPGRPLEPSDKEGFRFPDDKGGALLARLLSPSLDPKTPVVKQPRRLPPPASLESPTLPLAPVVVSLPRVSLTPKRPGLTPRLVLDETLDGAGSPILPQSRALVTGDKTRMPSVDVNQPVALPVLARPTPDRASLEDPTTEASAAAAVSAPAPQRTASLPFQRLSVPDPFEHRTAVHLKETPADETTPPLGSPRTPGR